MSEKPVDNPFCHLDNKQLAVFRSWLDDHWNWESDDLTSRRLKEMLKHAEDMQGTQRLYIGHKESLTIENIVAGIIRTEKVVRGDRDVSGLTNTSLKLVANHLALRLEFFLGKDIVDYVTVMKKSGFKETS
jgi:hypothetical protein